MLEHAAAAWRPAALTTRKLESCALQSKLMVQAEKEYKSKMEQLAGKYMVADTGLINAYGSHKSTCQSIRGRSAPDR